MLTPERGTESLPSHHYYRQPLKAAVFFCLLSLATRKRVHILLQGNLVICQIFFQLVLDILLDHLRILSYRVRKIPLHQKFRLPYLYFKFACLSNIIKLLFPLRYPINCAILIYGGILTSICIWSGHASASMLSAPFCSHSFRSISPISFRSAPYISLRRYFGANTM